MLSFATFGSFVFMIMLSCTLRYSERQALTGESSDVLNMEQKPEAAFMQVALQPLKNQPSIGRKRKTSGCIKDLWRCEHSEHSEHSHKLLPTPEVVFTILQAPRTYVGLDCPLVSLTLHWGWCPQLNQIIKLNLRHLSSYDLIRKRKDDVECKLYLIFNPTALVA